MAESDDGSTGYIEPADDGTEPRPRRTCRR